MSDSDYDDDQYEIDDSEMDQSGGAYKQLPQEALSKASAWRDEVRQVQQEMGISYKEALSVASQRRRDADGSYKTTKQRYVGQLDDKRTIAGQYKPYGSKNKRPLSLEAAQRILLQYYRDNRTKFAKGPLTALKTDIARCNKKVLQPCPAGIRTIAQAKGHPCANSWKYRPGSMANSRTGPAVYDMAGLDNLCGKDNVQARRSSKLYNMNRMNTKPQKPRSTGQTMVNPETGRKILVGGPAHKALQKAGKA